ncbi:hypothetical protein R1flu_026772 [Riccia fluitans]|uniref:Endonuclease V n=1 Tax=Riccia fluitans TaxID=41844 RepID=A0ABD1XGU9_9MARC
MRTRRERDFTLTGGKRNMLIGKFQKRTWERELRGPLISSVVDIFCSSLSRSSIVWNWNRSYSMENHRTSSKSGSPTASPMARDDTLSALKGVWMREQEVLKSRLVLQDEFSWALGPSIEQNGSSSAIDVSASNTKERLRYVGGVDLSFSKSDPSFACGALVVLDFETLEVVYEDFCTVQLTLPYIPGFLAFRESPILLNLLERMERKEIGLYPQLLMVDGNGILHPRGFGLASHLGVLANIPSVGVGKTLFHVDGLTDHAVRFEVSKSNLHAGETVPLTGKSGRVWGAALRSHEGCTKPIFISSGHRISLETAVDVVKRCCRHRIPEPVRQADMRSRERLRLMNHEAV